MNQALKSEVSKISRTSEEYSVLQSICRYPVDKNVTTLGDGKWDTFRKVLLNVSKTSFVLSKITHHHEIQIQLTFCS